MASESQNQQLHFVLFPLMAPGHMIPMVDIAKLLARRPGLAVTILTTPLNAARFRATLSRAVAAGLNIHLLELRFPSSDAGLPESCENFDALPSLDLAPSFFAAINMLRQEAETVVERMEPRPSCLISDMGLPWTAEIALRLNIPRLVFHGTCCFSLLCNHRIMESKILESLGSDSDRFVVPDFPVRIEFTKSQLPSFTSNKSQTTSSTAVMAEFREKMLAADRATYGVVVNSFEELEPEYAMEYYKEKHGKVWCIGPVSFSNQDHQDQAARGDETAATNQDCLTWLDGHRPGSVVYASMGSLARLNADQMAEIGLGLEATKRPFIWVLGRSDKLNAVENWIARNGFEERNKEKALLVRGWAPQVLILAHPAIGGFFTHCGWNSTLEGISAGVPMATWPLFAEQFCNEKLVVEVLGIGVSLGVQVPVKWGDEDKIGVLVKKEEIKEALEKVMDEGDEGEERRKKAREAGEMAKKAMEEFGSSTRNLSALIQEISSTHCNI
ncbi:PREDICTED: UDP-glycosyltransferase 73C3-like [Ipomoea nil]|uniref:UDP-glycosyltransferase 73C3-like n=1 Tax=Ipomoea nil TaxID=35883 RepID=UPI000901756B|nr:PREDICTED: UDP-glycosyltransferase 73C3-like [Ipomoea nil]